MLLARKSGVSDLSAATRQAMYRLFSHYYENVSRSQFDADLSSKDFVLLLLDECGELAGFTTAGIFERSFSGATHRIVFSGDTIMSRQHWGKQTLAQAWLHEMGRLARQSEPMRLFWFLIVKGHRTYRYLPTFALRYVPHRSDPPAPELLPIRDSLASEMFQSAFDPASGIISFSEPRGNLLPDWAGPSERERRLPDVAYFLKANPARGRTRLPVRNHPREYATARAPLVR
jgi:hypothetical protein